MQKKWCDLVAHIAQQPLPVSQMPRKITVFLSAPPGDGIRPSRDYFKEYIKPVLVAAAMDYDVIEGRKEGDIRYGTAEQIRRLRRKKGEQGTTVTEEEMDVERAIDLVRDKMHVQPEPGRRGDLVIGRHTWKEYIRGLHEGWLGPVEEPTPPSAEPEPVPSDPPTQTKTDDSEVPSPDPNVAGAEKKADDKEKKSVFPPPSYLPVEGYSSAPLSPHTPSTMEPSVPIHQQHLLGFLKTPQRIYNFLNRRSLADSIGRETAAVVLAAYRPYRHDESFPSPPPAEGLDADPLATKAPENDALGVQTRQTWEQQTVLESEEATWHKSVRKPPKDGDKTERVWLNDVVLDSRIAERMRRFELDPAEEERADRIARGEEKGFAVPVHDLRSEKVVIDKFD